VGAVSKAQTDQRAAYKRAGVKLSADKAVERETVVERMGSAVDGVLGHLSVPLDKCFNAVLLLLYLLSLELVLLKWMQIALGRLIRIFEYRRPLFGALNSVWRFSSVAYSQQCELLIAC
jgi:hypothetical protein